MSSDAVKTELLHCFPWQATQWQQVLTLAENNRLPHALLLSGFSGLGKRQFALALAYYLLCEQPHNGMACGRCRQCGFNRAGTHPDLNLLEPEEVGKAIKIEQVRELVDFLGRTSLQGGYKIALLAPAEKMTGSAANALLKSLEEPAANTLLMLLTDSAGLLLATVRSRCQTLVFTLPPPALVLEWLTPQLSARAEPKALLEYAGGRPLAALALVQSDGLGFHEKMSGDLLQMFEARKSPLQTAQAWLDLDMPDTLEWLATTLQAMIRHRVARVGIDARFVPWAKNADLAALFELVDKVLRVRDNLKRGLNPNKQLALEELLLESCGIFYR